MRAYLKGWSSWLILVWVWFGAGGVGFLFAQGTASNSVSSATNLALPGSSVRRTTADLENLVAPIALYPDPLIASVLPASAYPVEIAEAARFVKDTNNLARLDQQPWDPNVKAVARVPEVLAQMDNNIAWTSDLGEAFINQPKELMTAIQTMRQQAQASAALQSTAQQTVSETNGAIEVQPAESDELYVPQYNPSDVYADYSPEDSDYNPDWDWGYYPDSDYYSDYWAGYWPYYYWPYPYISFIGVGVFTSGFFNNECDFHHGDVRVHHNLNVAGAHNVRSEAFQTWRPDPQRLETSGSMASAREARGWNSAGTHTAATVQQRGTPPQLHYLSPTSTRESPSVVNRASPPVTVQEGSRVIYGSDSSPRVYRSEPSPTGTYNGYRSTAPTYHGEYSAPSTPMHEYSAPSEPMYHSEYSAPSEHVYTPPSTPPSGYEYSAPSEGHVYDGGGRGYEGGGGRGFSGGGGGHVGGGGFSGGHGGGGFGGGGGGGHGR